MDKARQPGMFILIGSHQPDLHKAVSQSPAGRTALRSRSRLSVHSSQFFQ
jgi:hypothetical protein